MVSAAHSTEYNSPLHIALTPFKNTQMQTDIGD